MADNSLILKHIPGGVLYHVDLPAGRSRGHYMLPEFAKLPLARIPVTNNGINFKTNIPINLLAASLNATGWAVAADLCHRCNRGSGQFRQCVYPYLQEHMEKIGFACSNCFYQYEASRCSNYKGHESCAADFQAPGTPDFGNNMELAAIWNGAKAKSNEASMSAALSIEARFALDSIQILYPETASDADLNTMATNYAVAFTDPVWGSTSAAADQALQRFMKTADYRAMDRSGCLDDSIIRFSAISSVLRLLWSAGAAVPPQVSIPAEEEEDEDEDENEDDEDGDGGNNDEEGNDEDVFNEDAPHEIVDDDALGHDALGHDAIDVMGGQHWHGDDFIIDPQLLMPPDDFL